MLTLFLFLLCDKSIDLKSRHCTEGHNILYKCSSYESVVASLRHNIFLDNTADLHCISYNNLKCYI